MKPIDYLKAAGVGLVVLACTFVCAFPMVAFYAYVIEPGHPREFYTAAAQWIAPWSSHLLGPLLFLGLNFRLARARPDRDAFAFAVATIVGYVLIDASTLPLFGGEVAMFFQTPVLVSLAFKAMGAVLGAHLGQRPANSPAAAPNGPALPRR